MKRFVSESKLEFKSDAKAQIERKVIPAVRPRLQKVRVWRISSTNKVECRILVGPAQFLTIKDVEEVSDELHLRLLSQGPGIIRVEVKPSVARGTTLAAATTNRNLARIQVTWMRIEFVDWKPGLKVCVDTEVQPIQGVPAAVFTEGIASKHVNDVFAIAIEWADGELIAEQIQITLSEVKQRTNRRVGLAIIVAQVAFKVTF